MKQWVYRLTLPNVLCVVVIWQCALSWDVFVFHSQANKSLLWSKHLKVQLVYSLPPVNSTCIGLLWFEGVHVSYVIVFVHVEVAVFSVVWFDYWCKRLSQTGSGESNGVRWVKWGLWIPVWSGESNVVWGVQSSGVWETQCGHGSPVWSGEFSGVWGSPVGSEQSNWVWRVQWGLGSNCNEVLTNW